MTSNIISSTVTTSDLIFTGGGRVRPLTIVRRPTARSMRLTIDPRDASVLLSLPTRAALRPALAWAAGKRDWIECELARLPDPQPIAPGMVFTVAGEQVQLSWTSTTSRTIRRGNGVLNVGGPAENLTPRLLRYLRREALLILEEETRTLAARNDIMIRKVAVGDPKSRWGSCASSGDIRYSWRLILAPTEVRRATVAHEVAHRVHMNHSAEFHALVATMHGADPRPARHWLRSHGAALHWFGCDG
ncbi:MAG: family peptidase [Sphingomonadales bacterium]|nr:family peptidase [Sphingomonadales bacterium]